MEEPGEVKDWLACCILNEQQKADGTCVEDNDILKMNLKCYTYNLVY